MAIKREKVIRTAEKLAAKGKLEAAIREYRKVLAQNPNDANTLNRVGDLYARIERFDEAVKLFSQIAEQYTRDGFFVKAIAIYKKIIKLSPQSLQVYERLAELYHRQGLLNEARTQYQILADHYEKRDNATSAINIYQQMTEIDPDNPAHYLKLAQLYQGQQLTDKALAAYRHLANLFLVNGSIDEATQVYLSVLDTYSQETDFVRDVVRGLHDEGHVAAAEKVLAKAKTLNPEMEAIAREVFAAPEPAAPEVTALEDAAAEAATLEGAAAEPAAPEPTVEEVSFDLDDATGDDDSIFDLPEAPSFEPAAAAPQEDQPEYPTTFVAEEDVSVFTLDLEDDEPPNTQVLPPPDMLEEVSGELEDSGEPFDEVAVAAQSAAEAPEEIDWSIDATPDFAVEAEETAVEFEIEIEEPEQIEAVGLEAAEPGAPEPAAPEPAASEPAAPEPGAPPSGAPVPAALVRHEDLLAEAKVFAKYGLSEKAEDRLRELLGVQPEHLGGLSLMAQIELDSGRPEEALERAKEVARIAKSAADLEPWNELREELAKAGYSLEEDQVTHEPAENDRFARLLEDLDETATGLTVIPEADIAELMALEPEPVEAEPVEVEPAAPGPELAEVELAALEPEPDAPEDLEPRTEDDIVTLDIELTPAPGLPAASNDTTASVGEEALGERAETSAAEPSAGPPGAPEQEPFIEIEALMQSITREAGFEELIPEETILEDLMPFEVSELPDAEEAQPEAQESEPLAEELTESGRISLVEELGLDELGEQRTATPAPAATLDEAVAEGAAGEEEETAAAEPPAGKEALAGEEPAAGGPAAGGSAVAGLPEPSPARATDLDENGMSWLDDIAAPAAEGEIQSESIFEEEDDFFDLAAELEAEIAANDEQQARSAIESGHEQSLEEIIEGFKRGVAENLSPEDYDTHYNLGIAYREMGLLDEAIGEFQLASKDPRYIVDCSSMLGICFLDKGLPELAVRWYRKGLESPTLDEDQALGLLYDLGSAYAVQGDTESAYRTFVEIYGINSNYRDAAQRIHELREVISSVES